MSHLPIRPAWTCGDCGAAWPCESAKGRLRAEFDGTPVSMALYLGQCFVEACGDLATAPAGTLHARFLGWIRR